MEFKIGDKIRVVKRHEGVASLGTTGVVISNCSWKKDGSYLKYSLEERCYELKLRGISNPNNKIIVKI